jgi:poly(A) RNA polymerase GLD2
MGSGRGFADEKDYGWNLEDIQEAQGNAAEMMFEDASGAEKFRQVQSVFREIMANQFSGRIEAFGSYRSGFKTGGSDIDVVYMPGEEEKDLLPITLLERFKYLLAQKGFMAPVCVFQASMPLLKATCPNGAELDLCVSNELGLHNSRLMAAYAGMDPRVVQVGQYVKHWSKYFDITCSSDGHLNSYAYTLMTIYYLIYTDPPVLPNLQEMSAKVDKHPIMVKDQRWGCQDEWDCQFWQDTHIIHHSMNTQTVGDLLLGFFEFYANVFDWETHAVAIRLAKTPELNGGHPNKEGLLSTQGSNAWYIEDPFDRKHNLAALCTDMARQRILEKMSEVRRAMRQAVPPQTLTQAFWSTCPRGHNTSAFYLKCRVHTEKISLEEFMAFFSVFPVEKFHWPQTTNSSGRMEAFLKFGSESDRRHTHTVNEQYLKPGWQVRLLVCSVHAIDDAMREAGGEESFITREGNGPDAVGLNVLHYDQPWPPDGVQQGEKSKSYPKGGKPGQADWSGGKGRWQARERRDRTSSNDFSTNDKHNLKGKGGDHSVKGKGGSDHSIKGKGKVKDGAGKAKDGKDTGAKGVLQFQ